MWQSHTLLRSETLLMCSQRLFQLAAPILAPVAGRSPAPTWTWGWLTGSSWPLAIQLRLEPATYLKQCHLPLALVGLGAKP